MSECIRFSIECRNCSKTVSRPLKTRIAADKMEGISIRCSKCNTTNHAIQTDPLDPDKGVLAHE